MSYSDDDYDEKYEEYCRQYEEEDYGDTLCITSGRFSRHDVDELLLPAYDEVIWQKYTSVVGQMFGGKNSKESLQYFMECYALKE